MEIGVELTEKDGLIGIFVWLTRNRVSISPTASKSR